MAMTVVWDDDARTIVRYDVEGSWTWDDYQDSLVELNSLLDTVDHKVDVIINIRSGKWIPEDVFNRFNHDMRQRHPNIGRLQVFVGAGMLIQILVASFMRIYGRAVDIEFLFADTLEEARQLIHERRQQPE